jgi:hypothetical protein
VSHFKKDILKQPCNSAFFYRSAKETGSDYMVWEALVTLCIVDMGTGRMTPLCECLYAETSFSVTFMHFS